MTSPSMFFPAGCYNKWYVFFQCEPSLEDRHLLSKGGRISFRPGILRLKDDEWLQNGQVCVEKRNSELEFTIAIHLHMILLCTSI